MPKGKNAPKKETKKPPTQKGAVKQEVAKQKVKKGIADKMEKEDHEEL